jgi:hypothetical protein
MHTFYVIVDDGYDDVSSFAARNFGELILRELQ